MEPAVSMSAYAAINTSGLVLLSLAGFQRTALILASVVLLWAAVLEVDYWRLRRGDVLPRHRVRLDVFVRVQVLACFAVVASVAASGLAVHAGGRTHTYIEFLDAAFLVAWLAVWLSSLIDWYWVLPRLAGFGLDAPSAEGGVRLRRPMPCQDPHGETWNSVTKVWLFHRGIATLLFIGGLAGIPGYLSAATHSKSFAVVMGITTLGVPAVMAEQAAAAVKALTNGLNPVAPLGSIVRIRMLEVATVYLVDVSLQGSKFKQLSPVTDPAATTDGSWTRKSDGPQIPNDVLTSSLMSQVEQSADAPCGRPSTDGNCRQVNWYCRCNAKAYSRSG
jgi:hypothetical protein